MKSHLSLIASTALLFAGCGGKDDAPGTNPVNAPTDYLGAVAKGKKKSEATAANLQVAPAIQQFHATEDRYPKDLKELVDQGYLTAMPEIPNGMKAEYNAETGAFKIVRTQ